MTILSERERHTLYGLYLLEVQTAYHLSASPLTPLHLTRGHQPFMVSVDALHRLNLDVLSGTGLLSLSETPITLCSLASYAASPSAQAGLQRSVIDSAARHPLVGAVLRRILHKVRRQGLSGLTLVTPEPLNGPTTALLREFHALSPGRYRLHVRRASGQVHGASYSVTDAGGAVQALTPEALRTLSIVHEGELHLRSVDGTLEVVPAKSYAAAPHNHQEAVTGWALAHRLFTPLRHELRERGAVRQQQDGMEYAFSVPLVVGP